MILLRFIVIFGLLVSISNAECPLSQNPRAVAECLRYFTSGIYGAIVKDLKVICSLATDIGNCLRRELGDCIAAQVGRVAFDELRDIVDNCCPNRNNNRCPIRDSNVQEQRCFAADSLVTLTNGKQTSIDNIKPGDSLLAYNDQTKTIISTPLLTMLDFQPLQYALFKHLTTSGGRQLSLTSSHLLPTEENGYVMAKNINVGMNIYVMNEKGMLAIEKVVNVSDVTKQGYVAPLTEEGTLIVNNVAASCYATVNSHDLAHAVLAPMRWWYRLFGGSSEGIDSVGIHWFPKAILDLTNFFVPSIIQK